MKIKKKYVLVCAFVPLLILIALYGCAYAFVFVVPRARMHRMANRANEIVVHVHGMNGLASAESSTYRLTGGDAKSLLAAILNTTHVDGNFYSTSRELTVLAMNSEGKVIDSFYIRQLLSDERHRYPEFIGIIEEVKSGQKLTQVEIESLPRPQASVFGRIELKVSEMTNLN